MKKQYIAPEALTLWADEDTFIAASVDISLSEGVVDDADDAAAREGSWDGYWD